MRPGHQYYDGRIAPPFLFLILNVLVLGVLVRDDKAPQKSGRHDGGDIRPVDDRSPLFSASS